jgi:cytochrome bd ubiquinol oxidase subunit II
MVLIWVSILALTALLYVVLDGFDLGVGILFLFSRKEANRRRMLAAISPVWDGNETWMVLAATILFGAFSKAFAAMLSAFYLPVIVGVCALILRGVAFEFRSKAMASRALWDIAFAGGSLVATFIQGVAVGALAEGLPFRSGEYAGGAFGWLTLFSILCGVGLCVGYTLLGAAWLVMKCEGPLRDVGYKALPWLVAGVLAFLAVAFADALGQHIEIMRRWLERPYLFAFPAVGGFAIIGLVDGVRRRRDRTPFLMTMVIFVAAFGTMAASFWPYMIPFSLTIRDAASPPSTLAFMAWGLGLIALPLILAYTAGAYRIFRGKVIDGGEYE